MNKFKNGYDPVTSADKSFEKFIRSRIAKKFPDHNVVGEEFGSKKSKSEFTWVSADGVFIVARDGVIIKTAISSIPFFVRSKII